MMNIRRTFYLPDDDPAPAKDVFAPLTRKEMIQSGMDVQPLTREEHFLKQQMAVSGDPVVFHAEADNPVNPFAGGSITESSDEVEAAYGKQAVITITLGDGSNAILPIVWSRPQNEYPHQTASTPIIYGPEWVYFVVNCGPNSDDMRQYRWTANMFTLTPVS